MPESDNAEGRERASMVWRVPRQPLPLTLFKAAGVALASALLILLLARIAGSIAAGTPVWAVPAALLLGYLCADLLSGTVHWFCDTFFSETTPILGPVVIQPFREHHDYPQRITRYGFLEQDTTNFFLLLPPLVLTLRLGAPRPGAVGELFWCAGLAGLALGSFGTNLFHKWAHMHRPPAIARRLQRAGLILSPRRHGVHHKSYDRGFCVTSGWLNPLLDAIGFFPRVERLVRFFRP